MEVAETISTPSPQAQQSSQSSVVDPADIKFKSKWAFWSVAPSSKSSSWEMRELFEIDDLATLWRYFNALKMPSEFGNGSVELAVFRAGVKPDWELEPCSNGGRWSARLDRVQSPDSLDQTWLNMVLGAVGESILGDESGELLGVAFSGKGHHNKRISVWLGVRDKDRVLEIGSALKENLRMELTDKDIGEMLFHDFESGNKSYAVIANSAKRRTLKSSKSSD
jgi:hypothetical protein